MTREEGADLVDELRQWGEGLTTWEAGWLEDIDDVLMNRKLTQAEQDKLEEIHGERLSARFQSTAKANARRL